MHQRRWDILLYCYSGCGNTTTPIPLGIDFSQDLDSATPTLTVTGIAGVPEPGSSAFILAAMLPMALARLRRVHVF